jgi:hypothetical protein
MAQTKNSRRNFLKITGLTAIGASSLSMSSLVGCTPEKNETTQGSKASSNLVTRKNIADIPANDPEIQLFRDAVKILKERSKKSPLDPMGWNAHGALHTTFCASSIYSNQVHYNWFVWPWHRAYLWSLEQKLQKAVGEPQLALHYWDWTKKNFIPEHYFGGAENPLYNHTREVGPNDEIPKDFMNVGAAFRTSDYKTFGGYPSIKKFGEPQLDGMAEQSFHNNIHNWIGGQMATFSESGYDPIFYAHHGNCDRIWEAWKNYDPAHKYPTDEEWLEKKLYVTDGNGTPVEFKIKELLDTEALGYRFHDLDINRTFINPLDEAEQPKREKSDRDTTADINYKTSEADQIYKQLFDHERVNAILHFDRVQIPYHAYCARVYFTYQKDGKTINKYTNTFTILPILDLDSLLLTQGVHLQIEVERELAEVIKNKQKVEVTLQPVPLPNRNIPPQHLTLENISLRLPHETA